MLAKWVANLLDIFKFTKIIADTSKRYAAIMINNLGFGVPNSTSKSPKSLEPTNEIISMMIATKGSLNLICDIASEYIVNFTTNSHK